MAALWNRAGRPLYFCHGFFYLNSNISLTFPYNMANFGLLAAEIISLAWGTPANFNGFGVLPALLNGTLVMGVSETLRGFTLKQKQTRNVGQCPT